MAWFQRRTPSFRSFMRPWSHDGPPGDAGIRSDGERREVALDRRVRSSASAIAASAAAGRRLPLGRAAEVAADGQRAGHRLVGGRARPSPRSPRRRPRRSRRTGGRGTAPAPRGRGRRRPGSTSSGRATGWRRVPDLAPVPGRRVGGRDQLVVLVVRPVLDLHAGPSSGCTGRRRGRGGSRARARGAGEGSARGSPSWWGAGSGLVAARTLEAVERALEPRGPGLEPRALVAQDRGPVVGLVGLEQRADRRQRQLEVPERGDGPRRRDLVAPVAPVAGAGSTSAGARTPSSS